jgi:hypothetical protein
MPSTTPADIDRYFTEQVVGGPVALAIGPSVGVRQVSDRGVLVEWLGGRVSLIGIAAVSLWAQDPARALAGQALDLPGLQPVRRRLLIGIGLLWSLLLGSAGWAVAAWLQGGR